VKSLDPRVTRLPSTDSSGKEEAASTQFGPFEVFVQPNPKKPFQHEGAVHAPNLEMAYVLAKEAFTRRFTCTSLYVVDTSRVFVSEMSEGQQSAFDLIPQPAAPSGGERKTFEIYLLQKRGKQSMHTGQLYATSPEEAMWNAKQEFNKGTQVFQIWAIATEDIRFTADDDNDLWQTLPEKKFRDASDYKGGDKLKEFLDRSNRL
jgi:ring-1,2-phenylacetyl-CoA epoxidase subunit PaaB